MPGQRTASDQVIPAPRETPDLIGHEKAERQLLQAWSRGRLGHAWMVTGPRGIGKATFAFRLARFILSKGKGGSSAPPESLFIPADDPVFRRVASGGHPDLVTVERGYDEKRNRLRGEIIVDDVRKLSAFFGLTAAEGGWRVAVVDSADELNRNAANALLKVLEEPPDAALIVLVSHVPGRLLPTIRSRCHKLVLGPLGEDAIDDLLGRCFPELEEAERLSLARLSEGSAGRAMTLALHGGLDVYREMISLLDTLPSLDVRALHALCDRLAPKSAEAAYRSTTNLLDRWLSRLIRAAAGAPAGESVPGEAALIDRLARTRGLDQWLEVWEKVTDLIARADSANLDRKQVLLSAFTSVEKVARG